MAGVASVAGVAAPVMGARGGRAEARGRGGDGERLAAALGMRGLRAARMKRKNAAGHPNPGPSAPPYSAHRRESMTGASGAHFT